jgi:hypothetical protein
MVNPATRRTAPKYKPLKSGVETNRCVSPGDNSGAKIGETHFGWIQFIKIRAALMHNENP